MKRLAKELCAEAERLGYVHERTNRKGFLVYVGPGGHEVPISSDLTEDQARGLAKAMQKATGEYQPAAGRSGTAVKDRQQARRELDATRLAAERRDLQATRDAYLARIATAPHLTADPEQLRRVEDRLREIDHLDSLMRCAPAVGDHQGRRPVKHTAGEPGPRQPHGCP